MAIVADMASDRTPGRRGGTRSVNGRTTTPKSKQPAATTSGRYTPPIPRNVRVSPPWVPILMGSLLAVGGLIILLNYMELLPYAASNAYLLAGLVLIAAGFVTATQWH
jgi:hypothetical protein